VEGRKERERDMTELEIKDEIWDRNLLEGLFEYEEPTHYWREPDVGSCYRPDFIVLTKGTLNVIEVKKTATIHDVSQLIGYCNRSLAWFHYYQKSLPKIRPWLLALDFKESIFPLIYSEMKDPVVHPIEMKIGEDQEIILEYVLDTIDYVAGRPPEALAEVADLVLKQEEAEGQNGNS
jgi:hypothetical protein